MLTKGKPIVQQQRLTGMKSKNILFVGVEWQRKGGPILLKVFEQVLARYPDASLTIVGCNPKNINLPNCNIIGKVSVDQVIEYYNSANVFCFKRTFWDCIC
jgi:glycosyltransferase involved in cell wall biosynthesis